MKSIYDFTDYKKFLVYRLEHTRPRLTYKKLSEALKVHSSRFSQIMNGQEDFTLEQAFALGSLLSLSQPEQEFFLLLVQKDRSGTKSLKTYFGEKIESTLKVQKTVPAQISESRQLTDSEAAAYYSDWVFQACRLLIDTDSVNTVEQLAEALGEETDRIQKVVDFLLEAGLCKRNENGNLARAVKNTHVSSDSPFVQHHHRNWRIKALNQAALFPDQELKFTCPMIVDKKAAKKIRSLILKCIQESDSVIDAAQSEQLHILNIDYLKIN